MFNVIICFRYNVIAKKLSKRLLQLGGNQIMNIGLADEQHPLGYDELFINVLFQKHGILNTGSLRILNLKYKDSIAIDI